MPPGRRRRRRPIAGDVLGARRHPAWAALPKHRRATSGWDSLTPTEIKIAAFVGEGLSNPEIAAKLLLSRRTIATHVSHIPKKLDVKSRIDIAREAALRTAASRRAPYRPGNAPEGPVAREPRGN